VANICWWYAMGADVDWTVTPRPIYYADGRKEPDCYTYPPSLHTALTQELGGFPLFTYWGPGAGMPSSRWICRAAQQVMEMHNPDLTLVYVPHLDYDLQRFGPADPRAGQAAAELDGVLAPLLDAAYARGATVVALSEYGITPVSRPVDINRVLRAEGLLEVYTQDGMEYLDPWTSRAFAVADHQVAHVYVRDPGDVAAVAKICAAVPGVDLVLDEGGQEAYGVSWCWWRNRTRGSPTTTGSTTRWRRTSRGSWRSIASPATTRPSCSSTRRRPARPNGGRRSRWPARNWGCDT
jgi:hypothetical protein